MKWIDYDGSKVDELLQGFLTARKWFGKPTSKSSVLSFKNVTVPAFKSSVFDGKKQMANCSGKIVPIIMSHGLTVTRHFYTALCAELASHGYIVLALDHHDGSCCHTFDKGGKPIKFDTTPFIKQDVRAKVLQR